MLRSANNYVILIVYIRAALKKKRGDVDLISIGCFENWSIA